PRARGGRARRSPSPAALRLLRAWAHIPSPAPRRERSAAPAPRAAAVRESRSVRPMREIAPGLWHWTARHEHIGGDVSSYYLERERVLIDAMVPAEGLEWLERHGPPGHVLMSNRHHDRGAWRMQERFGCSVHCVRNGLHEVEG